MEMEATVIRGEMTEKELDEYIEYIKRVYKPDKIVVVNNMKEAAEKVAKDIREL